MNREFIENEYFVFVIVFWLLFDKLHCFLSLFKIPVCRRLISKFGGDENDLHRKYAMVVYNTLILLWVGNSLVRFLKKLL